jgi:hypothetical protein
LGCRTGGEGDEVSGYFTFRPHPVRYAVRGRPARRGKHIARTLRLKPHLMTLCAENMNVLLGMRFCAVFFG